MLDLGNRVRGLFVKLPTPDVIDLVAASGFDFAVVDLEHSQLSEGEAFRLLRHAQATGFPALARVPALDRGAVGRLLEAGAAGIHLSTVRRADEVRELREATRYPPAGARSISLGHPAGRYGGLALADYLAEQDAGPPIVVAQIETVETEDTAEAIAAARPDVLFIGHTDLTVDAGLDPARVQARVDEVATAAERAGIVLGGFGMDDERVTYSAVSTDLALLRKAMLDAA